LKPSLISFIAILFLCLAAHAHGVEDFSRTDRTATLYTTRLTFNRSHVPVITVGIMDNQKSITITSKSGLHFLPDGEGGPSITMAAGRTSCRATISHSKPARIKYYVVMDSVPAQDLDLFTRRFKKLQSKGIKLKQIQVGSTFGFYGHILDNRRILIMQDRPFDSLKNARKEQAKTRPDLRVHLMLVNPPKGRITVRCKGYKTVIQSDAYIYFSPVGKTVIVKQVEFGRGFSWHSREDRRYTGLMYFAVDRHGKLAVVNAVDAETMLDGLVPSEMPHSAPMAALQAQAVAARNELFAKLGNRHFADPYMLCSDVHCQVYRGLGRENRRTTAAVRKTTGLLLFSHKKPVDTVYSSNCGGVNESPNAIWGAHDSDLPGGLLDKQGRRHVDFRDVHKLREFLASPPAHLYCAAYKRTFRWKVYRTIPKLRKSIIKRLGRDPGQIRALKVLKRGLSGRVLKLLVKGKGAIELDGELVIRQALGGLKSALFVMQAHRTDKGLLTGVTFVGGGFGHGAGMCQVGAMGMAKHGKTFKTILKHYYPGAKLLRIY